MMDLVVPFPTGLTAHQKWELMKKIATATMFNKVHHNTFEEFEDSLLYYPHMSLNDVGESALSKRETVDMSYNEFCKRYYKWIYLGGE